MSHRKGVALSEIDLSKCGPDSPLHAIAKKRNRGPSKDIEHGIAVEFFAWVQDTQARIPALEWLFAVPNFSGRMGNLTVIQGARLKAEGRRPGVPDYFWPEPRGPYLGLAFELKAPGRSPTREQKLWLQNLRKKGWLTDVCFSAAEARELVLAYYSGTPPTPQE